MGDLLRPRDGADGAEALVFHKAISTSFQREIHLPEEFSSLPRIFGKNKQIQRQKRLRLQRHLVVDCHSIIIDSGSRPLMGI
jgi:hypothetical protein